MKPINYQRVLLATLAAGVVANVCDFVTNGVLLVDDGRRLVQRLNLDPVVVGGMSVTMTWLVVDFIYAFLIVFMYAAIRPRFGPGPTTAAVAGLLIYTGVTIVVFGFAQMGIFTIDSFLKNAALSLVTALLTAWVGGYVYKE